MTKRRLFHRRGRDNSRPPPARPKLLRWGGSGRPPLDLGARGTAVGSHGAPTPSRSRSYPGGEETVKQGRRDFDDARTGMPAGIPAGAMCVQRFDDSLNSAIHITYRISLRSSSMPEPRDPLLKVLT